MKSSACFGAVVWGAVVAALAIAFNVEPATATPTLSITTSTVSGNPGQAVGWGFTLTNTADFVVLDSTGLATKLSLGTYQDFIASQFVVAGPSPESTMVSEAFNATTQSGLGSFTFNAGAAPGSSLSDTLLVEYSIFSEDPNSPTFDPGSFLSSGTLTADVKVDVIPSTLVPEPLTLSFFGAGLVGAAAMRRRKTKQ